MVKINIVLYENVRTRFQLNIFMWQNMSPVIVRLLCKGDSCSLFPGAVKSQVHFLDIVVCIVGERKARWSLAQKW